MLKRLLALILTILSLASSAVLAQSPSTGIYAYPSNSSISSPTQGSTWNFNSTDLNAYVYDYTGNWQQRTLPKLQLAGVGAPTASTDSTLGYAAGSLWYDASGLNLYVCTVNTASAAVWSPINNRTSPTDLANAVQGKLTVADFCSDYLVSGSIASTSSSLSTTTGSLVAYVSGLRQVTSASTYTYTASKDTYDYLQSNGTWLHVAVANGSSAPTGQTGLAIQKVVSGPSAITSVTQLASSYPVVSVAAATASTNNAIPINQADGRYCASGGSNSANQFYGTPAGASGGVSLRNLVAGDILFNLPVSRGGLGAPVTGGLGNELVGNGSGGYSEITPPSATGSYFYQNNGGSTQGYWGTLPVVGIALGGLGASTSATLNGLLIGNGSTYTQLAAPTSAGQFLRNVSAGISWSSAPTAANQIPYWNGSDYGYIPAPSTANTAPIYNGSSISWGTLSFGNFDRTKWMGGWQGIRPLPCAVPAAPTITHGGTTGSTSYSYAVAAVMADGTTITAASTATVNATGNATLSGTNTNIVTWSAVSGATTYNVYRTASSGTPSTTGLIGNTASTTFTDTGIAGTTAAPTTCVMTGDFYNATNWTQPCAITSNYVRIYNAGTLTFNNSWTVNTELPGGKALNAAGFGGSPGTGLGAGNMNNNPYGGTGGGFGGAGGGPGYLSSGTYQSGTYPISASLSGSGGSGGYTASSAIGGTGGAGGGSLYIESTGNISLTSAANINAIGGAGTTNTANSGSGGGGSGGGIQIRCLGTVTLSSGAIINAAGGAGGAAPSGGYQGCGGGGGIIDISASSISNSGSISAAGGTGYVAGSTGIVNLNQFVQGPRSVGWLPGDAPSRRRVA